MKRYNIKFRIAASLFITIIEGFGAKKGGSDFWLKFNIVKTISNFACRLVFMCRTLSCFFFFRWIFLHLENLRNYAKTVLFAGDAILMNNKIIKQ